MLSQLVTPCGNRGGLDPNDLSLVRQQAANMHVMDTNVHKDKKGISNKKKKKITEVGKMLQNEKSHSLVITFLFPVRRYEV